MQEAEILLLYVADPTFELSFFSFEVVRNPVEENVSGEHPVKGSS